MSTHTWDPALFARRRQRVLDELGDDAAMILPAAPEIVVGRDVELRYVVDPDLWYLTGYSEPEAVAVLCPSADTPFTLFVRDRDPGMELWTGPREEPEDAGERVGADAAVPLGRAGDGAAVAAPRRGPDLFPHRHRAATTWRGWSSTSSVAAAGPASGPGRGPAELADPGLILDDMRLVKEPEEIDAIRDAVAITVAAFREGLAAREARRRRVAGRGRRGGAVPRAGADGPAFTTIAASGPNATVLHYTANHRTMAAA
jgi:Xaa-Pro aminopeptidase